MTQQAELHKKIDTLPPEYFGEVIDFVGYLQQKALLLDEVKQSKFAGQEAVQFNKHHKEPLSKQFAGALRLSDSAYEALQNSLQEGRSEWNRDIF